MRCLTLADELKREGAKIVFITRKLPGSMDEAIKHRGHELFLLPAPTESYRLRDDDVAHASWLGVTWEQDAEETSQAIHTSGADCLIVDHYGIDARWHKILRDQVVRIMVIDDLAERPLECDVVFDQTYSRQEAEFKRFMPTGCRIMLGSRFALLRPVFSELRRKALVKRRIENSISNVLVSMGGVDEENVTAKVLEGLGYLVWKEKPTIDVVLGGKAPHLQ